MTLLGIMTNEETPVSETVKVAVFVTDPSVAVILTEVVAFTGRVGMPIEVLDRPTGILIKAGTGARAGLLLLRLMTTPPAGANPVSDTTPTSIWPTTTAVGNRASPLNPTLEGSIAIVPEAVSTPLVAVIVAVVSVVTVLLVVTVKEALVEPARKERSSL
jgi:hypothetical protein